MKTTKCSTLIKELSSEIKKTNKNLACNKNIRPNAGLDISLACESLYFHSRVMRSELTNLDDSQKHHGVAINLMMECSYGILFVIDVIENILKASKYYNVSLINELNNIKKLSSAVSSDLLDRKLSI